MTGKLATAAICAALVIVCSIASPTPEPTPIPTESPSSMGGSDDQTTSQSAKNMDGSPLADSPVNRMISPPDTFIPSAKPKNMEALSKLIETLHASLRGKRQAGIPPVCCTKDPCDPCATTPCIACPLCG